MGAYPILSQTGKENRNRDFVFMLHLLRILREKNIVFTLSFVTMTIAMANFEL